jgi:hypothetical protein
MSDVGEIAGAVGGIANLLRPLVEDAIANKIDKEHQDHVNEIQEAFSNRDPDKLWNVLAGMCNEAGYPPTPSGGVGANRCSISYELLHSLVLCTADAIQLRKYCVKLVNKG